jgi:hypothetical protein
MACNGELFINSSFMQCVVGVCTEFTKAAAKYCSQAFGDVVWMLVSVLALCT